MSHERYASLFRFKLVDIRIGREETVGIPEWEEYLFHHFLHSHLRESEIVGFHHRGREHIEPECIRSVSIDELHGIRVILERFTHLFPVFREDESVDDDIKERRIVEKRGSEDEERVEPSAGLIEPLSDEVRREFEIFCPFS